MTMRFNASAAPLPDHRGTRRHRFMESADINAAFRGLFRPLRQNIHRGLTLQGQLYALEMDVCIPGLLMGSDWIPPASRGIDDAATLADPAQRRALIDRLLEEPRPEALIAWVAEGLDAGGQPVLRVELHSADGCFVAEHPIEPGRGWRRRELQPAPHRRLDATPS